MIGRLLVLFFFLIAFHAIGQTDSTWNPMLLKKGNEPIIREDMARFSSHGFNLYRNCFYDFQLKDNSKKTLRLTDIKQDTLVFIGVSMRTDADLGQISQDTFVVAYDELYKLLLIHDWHSLSGKKVILDNFYFIFYKSPKPNYYESKLGHVFSGGQSEILPRLSSKGIVYCFEYQGKLYPYSGSSLPTPNASDENKDQLLNGVLAVLDVLVNRRITVTIQPKSAGN